MHTFHRSATVHGVKTAIFRVGTAERGDVFMCIARARYQNEQRAVVEVDASKFLGLWRNEPHSLHEGLSHGSIRSWKHDPRFADIDCAFQRGELDPVTVPDVQCAVRVERHPVWKRNWFFIRTLRGYEKRKSPYVSISKGITRTIWLLACGARVFPVECSLEQARMLANLAGRPGAGVASLDELC